VAAFVMGLICLIAGLYMFKGTQTIVAPIVEGGKNLARGAVA
jgi:energy-converting hydrogenase Eha subunit H